MDKEAYKVLVDKMGDSIDNILIINNFINKEDCELIVKNLNSGTALRSDGFWENRIFAEFSFPKECKAILKKNRINAHKVIKERFGSSLLPNSMNQHVIKWPTGPGMENHIDDESYERNHYHIASVLYLNDNYDGGEINFPTQGISFKPKAGDFIAFPGNKNYPHGVSEIFSGERYTAPAWYRFT
jgi:hypothetical protein